MIASVHGQVIDIALDHVVIEAAGVGYRLNATPATLATLTIGQSTRLYTGLVVREDALTLYGFADTESRDLFGLLQTVTGVGPRLAMAVLAVLEPEALRKALAHSDIVTLTRVPGVGRRGAERMVVELRDKVDAVPAPPSGSKALPRDQVAQALAGLGFAAKQAEQAIDVVLSQQPDVDTSTALRAALALLGKHR